MSYLTPNAQRVAEKRYLQRDENGNLTEDWAGLCKRVIDHVCVNETKEYKDQIFDLILHTKFIPNSPCLVNAGNSISGLLACHVSPAPEDTWNSMCENIKRFGDVARRGGGNGVCLSKIRPEGDPVFGSTHAKACGPIEHMRMISEVMNSITQAGFRAMANMSTMHVNHPDIINFIKCKQRERALKSLLKEDITTQYDELLKNNELNVLLDKFISNFNISVVASDKFMKAVENDEDWDLEFGGKIYQTVKAKELFDLIVFNAWRNGDPGLLFDDRVNDGPYKFSEQKINATNPCVAAGSLVATENGWIPVEDVKEGDLIWSRKKLYPVKTKEVNHNCELYRVEFSDGDYLDVTAAHKFKCVVSKRYEYRRLDELCEGAKVLVEPICFDKMITKPVTNKITVADLDLLSEKQGINFTLFDDGFIRDERTSARRDLGLIIGSVLGDGCFTESSNRYNVKVSFGHKEGKWQLVFQSLLDKYSIKNSLETGNSVNRVISNALGHLLETFGVKRNKAPDKVIPEIIMQSNDVELLSGILDGLFSTDGNMYLKKDNPMLRLSSSSWDLCGQVRRILLGFGIHARIYKSDRKMHVYQDPRYGPREISSENPKYDVVIMNDGITKFYQNVGVSNPDKQSQIKECVETYHYHGPSWTSTIRSITKLPGKHTVYDLYNEETDEWNVNGYIQRGCGEQPLPEFGSCNLGSIDVSKFWSDDLKDVDWKSLATAIHTAVQFLDDVIDVNKFPSKEFETWAKDNRPVGLGIMGWADLLLKRRIAYGSPRSIEFAEELAKFFEKEAHKKSVQLGKERGTPKCCNYKELDYRRNVTTVSIAPTGSISLLAGCNSGIEPFYSTSIWIYNNTGTYQVQNEFADKTYFRSAVHEDESKQVTWQQHIDMQAAFQKYVDSGISKTINMPNSATIEDVYKAYMRAWQSGCKGITVYRDGSKTTQVLNTKAKGTVGSNVPNKRPKDVPCDIFKTRADGFDWHVIVGKVDDIPYEVFAVNGRVELPESGTVTKKKKRHYSLTDKDGNVLIDNLIEEEHRIHPKVSLESRRFSLELRHGIHPKYIVDQIDKSHDVMTSFSKACGRIMKNKYLDSVVAVDELCPHCVKNGKQVKVINESGCVHCSENCGYSKCG